MGGIGPLLEKTRTRLRPRMNSVRSGPPFSCMGGIGSLLIANATAIRATRRVYMLTRLAPFTINTTANCLCAQRGARRAAPLPGGGGDQFPIQGLTGGAGATYSWQTNAILRPKQTKMQDTSSADASVIWRNPHRCLRRAGGYTSGRRASPSSCPRRRTETSLPHTCCRPPGSGTPRH